MLPGILIALVCCQCEHIHQAHTPSSQPFQPDLPTGWAYLVHVCDESDIIYGALCDSAVKMV